MLGPGDFFGEAVWRVSRPAWGGQRRLPQYDCSHHKDVSGSAAAALSDGLLAHMLARNIRVEQDLVDQLFNSREKCICVARNLSHENAATD
jgi:hypothetical protein